MSIIEQYRPPGRSNRSGRTTVDNDVFEGLPVKQWGHGYSRVSLAPPVTEVEPPKDDKWGEPPMPRDFQLLNPWTQHLLRLARSGKVGTKRKQDAEVDDDKPDDEVVEEEVKPTNNDPDDRGYLAKKWKPVPEHALEPEHKHFSFLAKRRRGLPSIYGPDQEGAVAIPMRKTKVQKADANGDIAVYEVLVPEGQAIDGEIAESTELGEIKPVTAAPGTVIEGVGVANEEGVMVAEHLTRAPRRNRPPPKKKGGPGRGKKRVTFTNPDGSTYTAIVPNATKIVPQPGQTVKHVAKGEEATADVTVEEAAAQATTRGEDGEEEGSGSDEDDGDDDDREEGEMSEDDTPATGDQTPAKADQNVSEAMEDVQPTCQPKTLDTVMGEPEQSVEKPDETAMRFDQSADKSMDVAGEPSKTNETVGESDRAAERSNENAEKFSEAAEKSHEPAGMSDETADKPTDPAEEPSKPDVVMEEGPDDKSTLQDLPLAASHDKSPSHVEMSVVSSKDPSTAEKTGDSPTHSTEQVVKDEPERSAEDTVDADTETEKKIAERHAAIPADDAPSQPSQPLVAASAEQASEQPSEQLDEQPAGKLDEQPAEAPAEQHIEQPAEQLAEQPVQQPTEQSAEQPGEQPTEQSSEQQTGEAAELPPELPTAMPAEAPAAVVAEPISTSQADEPIETEAKQTTEANGQQEDGNEQVERSEDGEDDLLGNLEKSLA